MQWAHEAEREEGHEGGGNLCRQPGLTGQREGESEHAGKETAADRWNPPVRRHGRVARLGRAGLVGLLWLFLFPRFSNCFSISVSLGF
jgi:hypothetical protein